MTGMGDTEHRNAISKGAPAAPARAQCANGERMSLGFLVQSGFAAAFGLLLADHPPNPVQCCPWAPVSDGVMADGTLGRRTRHQSGLVWWEPSVRSSLVGPTQYRPNRKPRRALASCNRWPTSSFHPHPTTQATWQACAKANNGTAP